MSINQKHTNQDGLFLKMLPLSAYFIYSAIELIEFLLLFRFLGKRRIEWPFSTFTTYKPKNTP